MLCAASTTLAGAPVDFSTIPQSCGVQVKGKEMGPESLDLIKELGVKVVRRGLLWEGVEKSTGNYDFSDYDEFFKLCKERGLTIIAPLAFKNKLYPDPTQDERGRQAFAKFCGAAAGHYRGETVIWEIWNEPNVQTFWGKHGKGHNSDQYADEYIAMLNACVPLMRKADPKCTILGGAVSGLWEESFKWMDFCFQKGILKTGIDAWSVHPYSTASPESYIDAYARMRASMKQYAAKTNVIVINSERGFPVKKGAEGYSGGSENKVYEYQAWQLVRQFMIDQSCDIKLTSWYEWGGTEGFALYNAKEKIKNPAYNAYKVMIDQLTGYHFDKRIKLTSDLDYVMQFVNRNGAVKLVAWTASSEPKNLDATVPHEVTLPVATSGPFETFSIYGEKGSVAVKDKGIVVNLTGAPQYISLRR